MSPNDFRYQQKPIRPWSIYNVLTCSSTWYAETARQNRKNVFAKRTLKLIISTQDTSRSYAVICIRLITDYILRGLHKPLKIMYEEKIYEFYLSIN